VRRFFHYGITRRILHISFRKFSASLGIVTMGGGVVFLLESFKYFHLNSYCGAWCCGRCFILSWQKSSYVNIVKLCVIIMLKLDLFEFYRNREKCHAWGLKRVDFFL